MPDRFKNQKRIVGQLCQGRTLLLSKKIPSGTFGPFMFYDDFPSQILELPFGFPHDFHITSRIVLAQVLRQDGVQLHGSFRIPICRKSGV
jgi:hypothetical protein